MEVLTLKKLAILFATFVCFAMISGSFAATNQNTEKSIGHSQYHKFVIIVPNNPTTGSTWRSIYDNNYVKLVNKEYVPDKANIHSQFWVGFGGYEVYTFYGKVGQKITLKHVDPSGKVFEKKNYWIE
jgi:predicted secreted protein